jgi:hypothetical protein
MLEFLVSIKPLGILAHLKKPLDFAAIDGQPTCLNVSPAS